MSKYLGDNLNSMQQASRRKGAVFGELLYHKARNVPEHPYFELDRHSEGTDSPVTLGNRLHFYIATDAGIVKDIEEVRCLTCC
jgi:hypothetical protein